MKHLLSIILLFITFGFAQDITNKLGGDTANETYDVTDSNDNILFRVEGDGGVEIGTSNTGSLYVYGNVTATSIATPGPIYDYWAEAGTNGQILSSINNGNAVDWIDAPTSSYVLSYGGNVDGVGGMELLIANGRADDEALAVVNVVCNHVIPIASTLTRLAWNSDGFTSNLNFQIIKNGSTIQLFAINSQTGVENININVDTGDTIALMTSSGVAMGNTNFNLYVTE